MTDHTLAELETMAEAARTEAVEAYINSLPMDGLTDRERTLIAGNIRGYASYLRAQEERPLTSEEESLIDAAWWCHKAAEPSVVYEPYPGAFDAALGQSGNGQEDSDHAGDPVG